MPSTPPSALYLAAPSAPAIAPEQMAEVPRTFTGIAYSGDAVAVGAGRLAIDLASVILPDPCPVLVQHDRAQRVGTCTLAVRDGALCAEGRLLRNAAAAALAAEADEGFPWQLSVHAEPSAVEQIPAGASAELNGRMLAGPLAVWRRTRIRELSFTPTGVDYRTVATVFEAPPSTLEDPMSDTPQVPDTGLAELQAQLAAVTERATAAEARAAAAEEALAEQRRAVRLAAVTATFAGLGRQLSAEEAAPYIEMPDAAWERVAADLAAARPSAPAHLFEEQATGGADTPHGAQFAAPAGYSVDPDGQAILAKVRAYLAEHPDTDFLGAVRAVTR